MSRFKCIIMGAAGRDFHDFQTFFREHPEFHVCCFTAAQIPFIDARSFPRELAGEGYEADIPIHPERELPGLIARHGVEFVFLSYSDLPHAEVMHRASLVQAAGASFVLLGPTHTELDVEVPVIAVTAVRTGAGKSSLSQYLAAHLRATGRRVGIVRHPMPYGDLRAQRVQRFDRLEDLDVHACTIEEREEYAPYLRAGLCVYAGVDYAAIARQAQSERDVILWDGGNNDMPFLRPTLRLVVLDALRPGHEVSYYPGETNLRSADILVINKVEHASAEGLERLRDNARSLNPTAPLLESDLAQSIEGSPITGKRVLIIEDGPTLTHGGMATGAGARAAEQAGATPIDPRPHAVGSIAEAYRAYPHLGAVLPALGYSNQQLDELRETIAAARPQVVVDASPAGVASMLELTPPSARVRYRFEQREGPPVERLVDAALRNA